MKPCPNCGYMPPVKPYQYDGYLRAYLPTILKLLRMKMMPAEVVATIQRVHNVQLGWGANANISYIRRRYGLEQEEQPDTQTRNREIARRYRAGDVTLAALGLEFGISRERVRGIIAHVERRAERDEEKRRAYQQAERIEDVLLDSLDLPVRVQNCFRNGRWDDQKRNWVCDCKTVGDAMKLKDSDLLKLPNFGRTSLQEWKQCLEQLQNEFDQTRVGQ